MPGIVGNIRGFVQGVVRGAVVAGRTAVETFGSLVESGLGYARSRFDIDFETYDRMGHVSDLIRSWEPDQILPGSLHLEATQNLSARFKYDLECVFEDIKGNTETHNYSLLSDTRLTPSEIIDQSEAFPAISDPPDMPMHGPLEIVGSWHESTEGVW